MSEELSKGHPTLALPRWLRLPSRAPGPLSLASHILAALTWDPASNRRQQDPGPGWGNMGIDLSPASGRLGLAILSLPNFLLYWV